MCSITDSEKTYCSEVEKMLSACDAPVGKSSYNLPLRRSQRLSQKLSKSYENNKNISHKQVPECNGVPLDLSHKFKESTMETFQLGEAIATKNVLDDAKHSDNFHLSEDIRPEKVAYNNKSQRPKTSSNSVYGNNVLKTVTRKTLKQARGNSYSKEARQQQKYFNANGITKTINQSFKNENIKKSNRVNNLENTSPENNSKDLAITKKLDFLLNNKLDEKTVVENASRKAFVKASCQRIVSMEINNESFEDINFSESLKNKPIELNLIGKNSSNIKPVKRGRKRKYISGEIDSKSNIKPSKRSRKRNPKSGENFSKSNTRSYKKDGDPNNVEVSDFEQINNIKSDESQNVYKTLNKMKPNIALRAQTGITKKKLCEEMTANTNFENSCNKVKTEKLSQKSYEEATHTNKYIQKIPSAIENSVCCQYMDNKFSTIEAKHDNLCAKFHTALSQETGNALKTFNSLQKAELTTENCRKEIQQKNSVVNKNYIKYFDKSQFLDNIRNARSYVDPLIIENNNLRKSNTFEIRPSPAESSGELLKKSFLLNTYPAHFKYQLPPEAVLSRSLDPQPLLTPDDTNSSELLDSSSSSPSLPESLCELFKTKDIKDILDLKQTSYHLNSCHIKALALILNLDVEYLLKILDKVVNISPVVLKNIEKAMKTPFVRDNDLFSNSSNELWNSSNVVPNSQSPKQRKISCTIK